MVLEQLRDATRPAHARIEAAVQLLPEPTRARYAWFLSKLYGFHAPLEERWAAISALHPAIESDLENRRRLPLLTRDLRTLGLDPASLGRCRSLPDLGSVPRALGVLYVTEGSTLGGQVLVRHIDRALGIGSQGGAEFLTGYGPRTAAMWGALCARLEAFGAEHPDAVGELVTSAVACFDHLQRWFEEDA